ncbi:hypothetical protein GCM10028815_18870 [Mariniluteicoccus flavus]
MVWLAIRSPEGIRESADPGQPPSPAWLYFAPIVVALALALVLPPPGRAAPAARATDRPRARIELGLLLVFAVVMSTAVFLPVRFMGMPFAEPALFLALPAAALAWSARR